MLACGGFKAEGVVNSFQRNFHTSSIFVEVPERQKEKQKTEFRIYLRNVRRGISTFLDDQGLLRFHRAFPSTFLDTSNVKGRHKLKDYFSDALIPLAKFYKKGQGLLPAGCSSPSRPSAPRDTHLPWHSHRAAFLPLRLPKVPRLG